MRLHSVTLAFAVSLLLIACGPAQEQTAQFQIEETTIAEIQAAILRGELTSTQVVELYLARIKAYNGTCVDQPEGILGAITTIPRAGKVNALITLNLRPAERVSRGFDERKARSMTDAADDDVAMPDALEVAAQQDAYLASTGSLIGPLHGVVMAIKDQFDTFDMRTTSGADAFYANDRPPRDAVFVQRLRDAGAIILAKANMGEYAAGGVTGVRSSFGGTNCNAYDTERDPGASSGGSGNSVSANLVTCAIGEETGTSVREPAKNNGVVGLAPTRELVGQIEASLAPLAQAHGLTTRTVFGGVGQNPQVTALRKGVDIVVAAPGRLEDLIGQGHCSLADVEVTVLDDEGALDPPPSVGPVSKTDCVVGIGRRNGTFVTLLDIDRLFSLRQIGAIAGAPDLAACPKVTTPPWPPPRAIRHRDPQPIPPCSASVTLRASRAS